MLELEDVLADYRQTKAQNKLVPGQNTTIALRALRDALPAALRDMVEAAGYNTNDFHIKASGEPNRSFPKIPWVAVFKKTISKSATQGYYIVFLFAEDMSSVSVSLNQGYTAFETRYVHPKLAYPKLTDCARAALAVLAPLPDGFDTGPIDLRTDGTLGKGYEAGSILSKTYRAGATPSVAQVQADVKALLQCYLALAARFPSSLIDLDVAVSDQEVLEAATNIHLEDEDAGVPKTTGPQPPPPMGLVGTKAKYVRSAEIVARALAMSSAACVLEKAGAPHVSFMSAKTKKNYVEAHHFVPFSQQPNFPVSLDVEENIAILCPNCHRMLHHGSRSSKTEHLKSLYRSRESALQARGIDVSLDQLLQMYKALDGDD
jgi:5-methylcytosine-specific restriction protein A